MISICPREREQPIGAHNRSSRAYNIMPVSINEYGLKRHEGRKSSDDLDTCIVNFGPEVSLEDQRWPQMQTTLLDAH